MALQGCGQLRFHFLNSPGGVEQEDAAFFNALKHVVLVYVRWIVAGHEVGFIHLVRGLDGRVPEAQVGDGDPAGLLRVILEVALRKHICVVPNNLNAVLVGTNGTVRTEPIELAGDEILRRDVQGMVHIERGVGDVVNDTHCKVVLRSLACEVVEDCLGHSWRELLGAQAVAAANHQDVGLAVFGQYGLDILVERFAQCTRFLGPIKDSDLLNAFRQDCQEVFRGERTVETDFDQAHFFTEAVEVFDCLLSNFDAGTHCNDYPLSIGGAVVIKGLVVASCQGTNLFHNFLYDTRHSQVVGVSCFTALEVDIWVLSRTPEFWAFGAHCPCSKLCNCFFVKEGFHFFVVNHIDLLDLMGCAEAIEEVDERNTSLNGSNVCHQSHIHDFLDRTGCEHSKPSLPCCHYVRMVAKDRQCVCSNRTS